MNTTARKTSILADTPMKTPPSRQPNIKETEVVCVQLLLLKELVCIQLLQLKELVCIQLLQSKDLVCIQLLQLKDLVCIQLLQLKEQFEELVCVQLMFKLVSRDMQLLLFKESAYGGHVVSASKI